MTLTPQPLAVETTRCSGGDCIEIVDIGGDWFRIRSSILPSHMLAISGDELRAFIVAVKVGQFDEIAGLTEEAVA